MPVTAPPPATTPVGYRLITVLRAATNGHHAAVEALPLMQRLTSPAVVPADYQGYLFGIAQVYATLESPLFDLVRAALAGRPDLCPTLISKLPALRADCAAYHLGWPDVAEWTLPVPPLGNALSCAVGGLYVLEGASLGGRVIARHLRRRFAGDGTGPLVSAAFLDFYGDDTGAAWRRFGQHLEALDAVGLIDPDDSVNGACQVFAEVSRILASARH